MIVTSVAITDYRYCAISARHSAQVSLTMGDRSVSLLCRVDLAEHEPAEVRATALMQEAKRQLCRMPEFRSGRVTLQFCDTLMQAPPQLA